MSEPSCIPLTRVLLGAAAWWLLVALVGAANQVGLDGAAWLRALLISLVVCAPWVPLTVALFALSQRLPFRRERWAWPLVLHLLGAALVVAGRAAYIYALDPRLHFYEHTPRYALVLMHSVQNNLFQYWLFVGVSHAAIYAREAIVRAQSAAQLEAALGRAELAALSASLHPHFLFNTLQAVAEMIHRDTDGADRMIVQLCAMLRGLLDDRRPLVPLRDELALVRDYLALEQVRFGTRLRVVFEVAPEVLAAPLPRLSLQPLVENALRHGLWPAGRPGQLLVRAAGVGAALEIAVLDDGVGPGAASVRAPSGHGLSTLRARVERLYPGRGLVTLRARPSGGAEALLTLPWEAPCAP